ncbi:MAG: hypothetical protein KAU20_06795 [Nanoarchaeota archaeon]|nr:hypothetical protein [Nanoarchaeota archaeon]
MKNKKMIKKISLVFLLLFAIQNVIAADGIIYINPASKIVEDDFTISIGVNTTKEVYAADITLAFDSGVLQATALTQGNFLNSDGAVTYPIPKIDNANGKISFAITRFGTQKGISGNRVLLTVDFDTIDNGESPLELENVKLSDASLKEILLSVINGSVTISGQSADGSDEEKTNGNSGSSGTISSSSGSSEIHNQNTTDKGLIEDCIPEWSCGEWGDCLDSTQHRMCEDLNKCGAIPDKPVTRNCAIVGSNAPHTTSNKLSGAVITNTNKSQNHVYGSIIMTIIVIMGILVYVFLIKK